MNKLKVQLLVLVGLLCCNFSFAQDFRLETKEGVEIPNGATVTLVREVQDMMLWGQINAGVFVRNLTDSNMGIIVEMKTITGGEAQICWGGNCVVVSVGDSYTTGTGVAFAGEATDLLIEALVIGDYTNAYITRTVEISVWNEKNPDERISATITFTNDNSEHKIISYMIDGELYKKQSVPVGETILPIVPSPKTGYTFSGWDNLPETMPNEDIIVYGYYNINSYVLTFEVDGEIISSESYTYGSEINAPEMPQKDGYTFTGWMNLPSTMPAKCLTVKGYYEKNAYTVTYTVDGVVYNTQTVLFESVLSLLSEPQMDGYTFSGWNCSYTTMPSHDITISGYFTVNSYLLTYILDGEIYKQENKLYGTQVKSIDVPQKEGYTFSGWGNVPSTMPANDLKLEGKYLLNQHTVTYYVDGKVYATMRVDYGAQILVLADLEKEGYSFSGWGNIPETMPDQDLSIEAYFTVNKYAVTYIVDGEFYAVDSVFYGEEVTLYPCPEREGYSFTGWGDIPSVMPAYDVVVSGNFSANSYQLIYIVDGEVYTSMQVVYGTPIYPIANPNRIGYIFSGWSEIPETMPAYDITVTGSFEVDGIEIVTMDSLVDVYNLHGIKVKEQILMRYLNEELPCGIYIINGKKVLVK